MDDLYDGTDVNGAVAGAGETPLIDNQTVAVVGACSATQEAMIERIMAPGRCSASSGNALSVGVSEYSTTMQRVEMVVSDGSCKRARAGNRGGEDYDFLRRVGGYDESIVDVDEQTGREVFRCARCFQRSFQAVDVSRFVELNPRLSDSFADPNYQYCSLQCVFSVACEVVGLDRRDMRAQFLTELEDLYRVDSSAIRYVPAAAPYEAACQILAESGATQDEIVEMLPVSAWSVPLSAVYVPVADSVSVPVRERSAEQVAYQAFHQEELAATRAAAEAYGQYLTDEQLMIQHQNAQLFSQHAAAVNWPLGE